QNDRPPERHGRGGPSHPTENATDGGNQPPSADGDLAWKRIKREFSGSGDTLTEYPLGQPIEQSSPFFAGPTAARCHADAHGSFAIRSGDWDIVLFDACQNGRRRVTIPV